MSVFFTTMALLTSDDITPCGSMRNPVVAQDGFTYEREEIENWFAQCRKQNERDSEGAGAPSITSPMTGAAMATTLSPNLLARSLIRKLKERNPGLD